MTEPLLRQQPKLRKEGDATDRLPTWWLFVLGSWGPPQSLFWTLIQGILVPAQVQAIVGNAPGAKQVALGYIATATQLGACWGPCIGTWSDRCNSPLGRRRPFMGEWSAVCAAPFRMPCSLAGRVAYRPRS